jgi:hypothetical protein
MVLPPYIGSRSGFGNFAAEGRERDVSGLRAAAPAGVQAVDRGELLTGQLEGAGWT